VNPILFTINDYSVRSYLVIILAAILLAFLLIRYYEIPYLKARNLCPDSIDRYNGEALFVTLVFIVIGARLGFVITNWQLYGDDPLRILALWRGGLAFHGGLVAALIAIAIHSRIRHVPLGKLLDLAVPYVSLAYAVARVGCFLNGCCHGHVTDLPWGLVYPAIDGAARHPTQLYSAAAALFIAVVLFYIHRKNYPEGITFAWFLILFGCYRFLVEFFRTGEVLLGLFSLAQVVSVVMIIFGLTLLLFFKRKKKWREKI